MIEDEDYLLPSHPLSFYLKSLRLEEMTEHVSETEILQEISQKTLRIFSNNSLIFSILSGQVLAWKSSLLQYILNSNILVEDDYVLFLHYRAKLQPYFPGPSKINLNLCMIVIISAALYNVFSASYYLLAFTLIFVLSLLILFLSELVAWIYITNMIDSILKHLECVHRSSRHCLLFLQGVNLSHKCLAFVYKGPASSRASNQIASNFTIQFEKSVLIYFKLISSICLDIRNAFDKYTIVDYGSNFTQISLEETINVIPSQDLKRLKSLYELSLFMHSELLRRLACFTCSQTNKSLVFFGLIVRALWRWESALVDLTEQLEDLDRLRKRILSGEVVYNGPQQRCDPSAASTPTSGDCEPDNIRRLSLLKNLLYYLLSGTSLTNKLIEDLQPNPDAVSSRLSEMAPIRFLLEHSICCIDEVTRPKDEVNHSKIQPHQLGVQYPAFTASSTPREMLEAKDREIEYEILEAIADENGDELNSTEEQDYNFIPDKIERDRRAADRCLLLNELNSIISVIRLQTEERENSILARSHSKGGQPTAPLSRVEPTTLPPLSQPTISVVPEVNHENLSDGDDTTLASLSGESLVKAPLDGKTTTTGRPVVGPDGDTTSVGVGAPVLGCSHRHATTTTTPETPQPPAFLEDSASPMCASVGWEGGETTLASPSNCTHSALFKAELNRAVLFRSLETEEETFHGSSNDTEEELPNL